MQKIAAYRLEHELPGSPEPRKDEINEVITLLKQWLGKKYADDPDAPRGEFKSESSRVRGSGFFEWQRASDDNGRSCTILRLVEDLSGGRRFETSISVTDTGSSVIVFATLASGLSSSAVVPVPVKAMCPRPIRQILKLHDDWKHGSTSLQSKSRRVTGREQGREFAQDTIASQRTIPLILISEDDGELVLPGLERHVARALIGLAHVVVIDEEASWGVCDALGSEGACYWGAVRIFWPHFPKGSHPLWTERRLTASGMTAEQFATQLRARVMRASARSVVRPKEIEEIRRAAQRLNIEKLKTQFRDDAGWEELITEVGEENERLLAENRELRDENEALQFQLQNLESQVNFVDHDEGPLLDPDPQQETDPGPQKGDVCFYKKTQGGSGRTRDKMVETKDCGHSAWRSASKADKAKKGIHRLVNRRDWKSIQYCGSCEGGGMYKVRW